MGWTLGHDWRQYDWRQYDGRVRARLERDAVENTVALTLLEGMRAGRADAVATPTSAWYEHDGEVLGSAFLTPPFELVLVDLPGDLIEGLALGLASAGVVLPGVSGRPDLVDRFLASWRSRDPRPSRLPAPAAVNHDAVVAFRIGAGLVWVWECDGGLVSMAGRNQTVAQVARVGPIRRRTRSTRPSASGREATGSSIGTRASVRPWRSRLLPRRARVSASSGSSS
jgi:hypothetical protein